MEKFAVYRRRFVQCRNCGLSRLLDRIAPEHLGLLYGDYYPLAAQHPSAHELEQELANPTFAYRVKRLRRHLPPGEHSMFELGAGDGNFLGYLRRKQWEVGGTEFTEKTAALVRSRHAAELMVGDLADLADRIGPRPLVGAYHVIEHVYEPAVWLGLVRRVVAKGGLLHLQTPNFGSLEFGMTRSAFSMLSFPQHVYLYTPSDLEAMLREHGFEPIDLSTYDPWHSPHTVVGSLGNLVKYKITHRLPWPDHRGTEAPAAEAAPPPARIARARPAVTAIQHLLRPLAIGVARLESLLGRGSVIDVIARAV